MNLEIKEVIIIYIGLWKQTFSIQNIGVLILELVDIPFPISYLAFSLSLRKIE